MSLSSVDTVIYNIICINERWKERKREKKRRKTYKNNKRIFQTFLRIYRTKWFSEWEESTREQFLSLSHRKDSFWFTLDQEEPIYIYIITKLILVLADIF